MKKMHYARWAGILFIPLILSIEILNASVKNNSLSQAEMNMFTANATPTVRLFASDAVTQLQNDVKDFDKTLNTYIKNGVQLHKDLQTILTGLNTLNMLAKGLDDLDKALTAIEKGIKYAEDIPQTAEKATNLENDVRKFHPSVTKASKSANDLNNKITPTRENLQSFNEKLQTLIEAATAFKAGLDTYTSVITQAQNCISSLPDGSTKDNLQTRLDKLAGESDNRVVQANSLLQGIINVVDDIENKIKVPLEIDWKPIDDLETEVTDLLKDLNGVVNPLKDLENLFGKELCYSIPYYSLIPPFKKKHYNLCVGFDIIIHDAEKIKDEIKRKMGPLYKIAEACGIDKIINDLKDQANKLLDPILKALHLDIKMDIPGIDQLEQNLKLISDGLKDLPSKPTIDTSEFDKLVKDINQDIQDVGKICK